MAERAEGSGVQQLLQFLYPPNADLYGESGEEEVHLPGKAQGICQHCPKQMGLGGTDQLELTTSPQSQSGAQT